MWITEGDLLNLDPIKWQQFQDGNVQELCSLQPEENDAEIFQGFF
jgi:hypothetical protein